MIRSSYWYSSS